MNDSFKTIQKESKGYFKDKGSKFYSFAFPVKNEAEIKDSINLLKKEHHKARHHCYAWRLGTDKIRYRANDDGEPSSTAGRPILGQLQGFELTDILVVVVRYFGGTLLGVSGLIHAYRNATINALDNACIVEKRIEKKYRLTFTYNELNEVMQLIKQEKYNIVFTDFKESCTLVLSVRKSESERAEKLFNDIYKVQLNVLSD